MQRGYPREPFERRRIERVPVMPRNPQFGYEFAITECRNEMANLFTPPPLPRSRAKSGHRSHAPAHGCPVNDNFKPTVSFQYLQLLPMTLVLLIIVALVWIVSTALWFSPRTRLSRLKCAPHPRPALAMPANPPCTAEGLVR